MTDDSTVVVSCAVSTPKFFIRDVVIGNLPYLFKQFDRRPKAILPALNLKDKKAHTENVRNIVCNRATEIAPHLFKLAQNISVGASRTRWGSCDAKRNLRFHYKIIFLPSHLVDYIVAHELAHLVELNHSARFWHLVHQIIPDAHSHRKELKKYNLD